MLSILEEYSSIIRTQCYYDDRDLDKERLESLKSQIEKAIEFYNFYYHNCGTYGCSKCEELKKQNQKSPQDIEKAIEFYNNKNNCLIFNDREFAIQEFNRLKQNQKSPQDIKNQEIVDRLKKAYRKENNSEYGLVRKELIKSILDGGKK